MSLIYGDRLPTVALAQSLLVAHGFQAPVDGHFGTGTRNALVAFQQQVHQTEGPGTIGPRTWDALSMTPGRSRRPLRVVEQVDGSDTIGLLSCPGAARLCEVPLGRSTAGVVDDGRSHFHLELTGGPDMFKRLVTSHPSRSVDLLRFHGHGAPGHQNLFWGTSFDHTTIATPPVQATLVKLGEIMRPTGSIELHGCNTGQGERGHRLLQAMADATRVPVSAGRPVQLGGGASHRFEGAVVTCCPSRRSLTDWARSAFGGGGS